ncbi:MAG: zinc ribbon domain-containing protein [Microcoleaceae cyanobacterium]
MQTKLLALAALQEESPFAEEIRPRRQEANAGVVVVKVKPHGTSTYCSNCGHKVKKSLAQRQHNCPSCGLNS